MEAKTNMIIQSMMQKFMLIYLEAMHTHNITQTINTNWENWK